MKKCACASRGLASIVGVVLLSLFLSGAALPERTITLDVKEAELHNVFRLMAQYGQVNIVLSDNVKGRITLKLDDVSWRDAFQAILFTHDLGVEQVGSVLWVDTLRNITERAELQAGLVAAKKEAAELKTIIVPLSFARADDILHILQDFLSERGSAVVDNRTNTIIVTDIEEHLENVEFFLQ